jgi:hypothetical protein
MPIEAPPMSHRNFWLREENQYLEGEFFTLTTAIKVTAAELSIAGDGIEAF